MAISASRKKYYQERIDAKITLLENAEEALNQALADGVEAATFDTGTYGARQHYKTLKLDALTQYIRTLESQIDRLMRKRDGKGLTNIRSARRG